MSVRRRPLAVSRFNLVEQLHPEAFDLVSDLANPQDGLPGRVVQGPVPHGNAGCRIKIERRTTHRGNDAAPDEFLVGHSPRPAARDGDPDILHDFDDNPMDPVCGVRATGSDLYLLAKTAGRPFVCGDGSRPLAPSGILDTHEPEAGWRGRLRLVSPFGCIRVSNRSIGAVEAS